MIRVIIHGSSGRMGSTLVDLLNDTPDMEWTAGIDRKNPVESDVPVFSEIGLCRETADVVIDFSSPGAVPDTASYCIRHQVPWVLAVTGMSDAEIDCVNDAASTIPVFLSPNFSLGVAWISMVLEDYAPLLDGLFQTDILEKHHQFKKDNPSGTALMLAEKSGCPANRIQAVRSGTIPGEHTVLFAAADETIEMVHRAYDRAIFARGALEAARFVAGRKPGLYGMRDLMMSRGWTAGAGR